MKHNVYVKVTRTYKGKKKKIYIYIYIYVYMLLNVPMSFKLISFRNETGKVP